VTGVQTCALPIYDFNQTSLKNELSELLFNPEKRLKIAADYDALEQKLGGTGASEKTAREIVRTCC
jgi:lipid-A-disaccharide synthase